MHAEYTIRALKAGKHVLCEKPMANTPAECEQMIAAAKAANRKLMIGYRLHYEPYNQALVKLARETPELGPTQVILADAGFNIGDPGAVAAAQGDGGRRLADGHRHLRAAGRALLLGRGADRGQRDDVVDDPNDVRFKEVEEHITFQLRFPCGHPRELHVLSYGARPQPLPRGRSRTRWAELEPALNYTGLKLRVYRNGAVEERGARVVDHFADGDGPLLRVHP